MNDNAHATPHYEVSPETSIFLAIDVQRAFGEAVPVPDLEPALAKLRRALEAWRDAGGETWLTQHVYGSPDEVGLITDFIPPLSDVLDADSPLADFHEGIRDLGDRVYKKTRFNALAGTNLLEDLRQRSVESVVVAGFTTPICVQATVDALAMADIPVVLLDDACASQPMGDLSGQEAHRASINRLGYVFAERRSTDDFVAEFAPAAVGSSS